jgi:CHAT domain-containing protein
MASVLTVAGLLVAMPATARLEQSSGLVETEASTNRLGLSSNPTNLQGTSDPPATSLLDQGEALYRQGRYAAAVDVLRRALQRYQDSSQVLPEAATWANLSLTYQALGDWSAATEACDRSIALLQSDHGLTAGEVLPLLAQSFDVQGRLHYQQGKAVLAIESWQQAAQHYADSQDPMGQLEAQVNQAEALKMLGQYRRAEALLQQVAQALETLPDAGTKAAVLLALAEAQATMGQPAAAQTSLTTSLAVAQQFDLPTLVSTAQLSLGHLAYDPTAPAEAMAFYRQALATAPDASATLPAQLALLRLLVATGQIQQAGELVSDIRTTLAHLPAGREAINGRIYLAQSLMQLHQQTPDTNIWAMAAATTLAEAISLAEQLGDPRAIAYAKGTLGSLYELTRQWPEAEQMTRQALALAETIDAADITYQWYWQLGRLLKVQAEIATATPVAGPGAVAPDYGEAIAAYTKAINYLQTLRQDLLIVNSDVQYSFRDHVEPVYREAVDLLLRPVAESTKAQDQRLKARELIETLQLAEIDNFLREGCLEGRFLLLDQLVEQDYPQAAVIYPILLDDRLEVIVKIPNQPLRQNTVYQSRQTIATHLHDLRLSLGEPDRLRNTQALSQQVYQWLIQPIETDLQAQGIDTLVFVLDGPLRSIPMAVLHDGEQYLIEKYALSLSLGLQLLDPQRFVADQANVLMAGLPTPPASLPNVAALPAIETELELVQQTGWPATPLLNQQFTYSTLEQTLQTDTFNVVHLATHGRFSSQADDTFILAADGPITIEQLGRLLQTGAVNHRSNIDLLVLSACETASGDNHATLGLAGLAIKAGARSTLASLWQIDDRSTALLMGEFYGALAQGDVTKAEALRTAQLRLLQEHPNYRNPIYWAPYVLVGNWL